MSRKYEAWMWMVLLVLVAVFRPAAVQAQRAEGIKVHGNWVIEVRNPDGSLAQRREFENALQVYGQRDLVGFLSRSNPVSFWRVITNGSTGMCLSGADYCQISESADNLSSGGLPASKNLTVTGADVNLVLRGSYTAVAAGSIGSVTTINMRNSTAEGPFSQAALSPAIAVEANQAVSVTVTFSFN